MNKLSVFLIVVLSFTSVQTFAFDSKFKGFIALDLLNAKKEKNEVQQLSTGIGTFDLKFYAKHDKTSMKIKLDLDDSDIGSKYKIFEEAQMSYNITKELRLLGGKGKVRFHQMRYGVINSHYVDGGSILGTNHSFRDQDNKILVGLRFGSYSKGFLNHFTLYGESEIPKLDRDDNVEVSDSGVVETVNTKTFSTDQQRGIANKLEWFMSKETKMSFALLYFYADYRPKETYAADWAGTYKKSGLEVFWEYSYAQVSTHPYDKYSTKDQDEHIAQIGFEKYLTDKWNLLASMDYAFVDSQRHTQQLANGKPSRNDGYQYETTTYKFGVGTKYKMSKSSFITIGTEFEAQDNVATDTAGVEVSDENLHAYLVGADLAFWF
ncbi:MAG: hypothetical protein ACPGJV_00465 [Bacteriovoracaceae bacterium]